VPFGSRFCFMGVETTMWEPDLLQCYEDLSTEAGNRVVYCNVNNFTVSFFEINNQTFTVPVDSSPYTNALLYDGVAMIQQVWILCGIQTKATSCSPPHMWCSSTPNSYRNHPLPIFQPQQT
jgi:hypothetical protein